MARSCMKTRTSSYKLLRKRHNYGRRGSEPSALAHIGRALNDELDTVYARAPLREVCPQERRERKKERIRVYIYIRAACVLTYTTLFLNRLPIFLAISFRVPRDERRCHPTGHLSFLPPPPPSLPARLISPRDEKVTKHLNESATLAFSIRPDRDTRAYKSRLENLVSGTERSGGRPRLDLWRVSSYTSYVANATG